MREVAIIVEAGMIWDAVYVAPQKDGWWIVLEHPPGSRRQHRRFSMPWEAQWYADAINDIQSPLVIEQYDDGYWLVDRRSGTRTGPFESAAAAENAVLGRAEEEFERRAGRARA